MIPTSRARAGMTEFETYIRNNRELIPNFGERYRQGERISTAFVESTINQVVSRRFVKKAADAVVAEGRAPAATDSHQGVEQRTGGRIPALVSSVSQAKRCSLTPDLEVDSILAAGVSGSRGSVFGFPQCRRTAERVWRGHPQGDPGLTLLDTDVIVHYLKGHSEIATRIHNASPQRSLFTNWNTELSDRNSRLGADRS